MKIKMYSLTYKSKARQECTNREIHDILEKSDLNNRRAGITGCLIYHKRNFIQILEGPKKQISTLMEKIRRDIRHSGIEIIREGFCDQRAFTDWAMGYLDAKSAQNALKVEEFEDRILQLSRLYGDSSVSVRMFWFNVAVIMKRSSRVVGGKYTRFR